MTGQTHHQVVFCRLAGPVRICCLLRQTFIQLTAALLISSVKNLFFPLLLLPPFIVPSNTAVSIAFAIIISPNRFFSFHNCVQKHSVFFYSTLNLLITHSVYPFYSYHSSPYRHLKIFDSVVSFFPRVRVCVHT